MSNERTGAQIAVYTYMTPRHVDAFKLTAAHFQVWILVRRGNEKSRRWIGQPGYIPKMLDCKAKTAQIDAHGEGSTAGLVVSPLLVPAAFKDDEKLRKAREEWAKFEPQLYIFDPKTAHADDKANKHYTLQLDKSHKHYGCVMYKPVFRSLGEYIHADYDLYAVVSQADPKTNIRVEEKGCGGQAHSRGPKFYDVQYYFKAMTNFGNRDAADPMVRHGEQETYKADWDDVLDVFWPDGKTITELAGEAAIQEFYRTALQGRRQYSKDTVPKPHFGNWQKI